MADLGVIDRFLAVFTRYIDTGFGLVEGDVAWLTSVLIAIDITLAGLTWAMAENENVIARLIKKVLYVGAFALILNNFAWLADIVFASFAGLGLKASGATMTAEDLMRPGFVAAAGYGAAHPILEHVSELMGFVSFFENFPVIAVLFLAWLTVLAAFFLMAIQLFIAVLEFKLTALAGFILVPFALWNKTAFLAEKVLGNVVASGVKLMVLAVVVGIGSTLFGEVAGDMGDEIELAEAATAILAALSLLGLSLFGPGIAAGLVSGAPQLGAGAAVGTVLGAGAGVAAGTMAAVAATRTAASLGGGAMKTAAFTAGAAGTAYGLGRAASGESGVGGMAAGLSGLARAGAGAMKDAGSQATAGIRESYAKGGAKAYGWTGGQRAGEPSSDPIEPMPAWAKAMTRRQTAGHAALTAAHTLEDGDAPMQSSGPNLKDN